MLDEWDREFREHGYSLTQLDSCKKQLVQATVDVPPTNDQSIDGERKWTELKEEETLWLKKLGEESDLDVDALVALCNRILKAAHKELRGGYGVRSD